MIYVPEMLMIGGNSRNSGKTTLACKCISQLSAQHEVIGLKVTSIHPGENDLHGNHNENNPGDFTISEELNPESHKDTSQMLKAGATHVYYIRVENNFTRQAISHFLSTFVTKQLIVCESRSLREVVKPGLFLIMMRLQVEHKVKDMSKYLVTADKVFHFDKDSREIEQFTASLEYKNRKFVCRS